MPVAAQDLLNLIILSRNVAWRLSLDTYEEESLKLLLRAVQRAEREVLTSIDRYASALPDWAEERALALLDDFSDITLGVRSVLGGGIIDMAAQVGAASFLMHNDILSFGGRVLDFNTVSLTAAQMRALIVEVPVGGRLLNDWVLSTYGQVAENIRENILTGMLKGDDYRQFTNRLTEEFGMAKKDGTTLARTYVHSANTFAQETLYRENADIVKGVKWTAILEPGFKKTGYGTCLRCAVLDGTAFPLNGPKPPIPLHPNCRCLYLPQLVSWRELGVDMDELPEVYRPYTIRPNEAIKTGGRRTILEHGFHDGDYASWMAGQTPTFKRQLLGPNRYELVSSGKVKFQDLIERNTGRLKTLQELM